MLLLLLLGGLMLPALDLPSNFARSPLYAYHYRPGLMKQALVNHGFDPRLLGAPVDGFASTPEPGKDGQCPRVDPANPWVGLFSVNGHDVESYLIVDCTARRDLSHQVNVLHLGAELDAQSAKRNGFYWNGESCQKPGWCGHAPVKIRGFVRYSTWIKTAQ